MIEHYIEFVAATGELSGRYSVDASRMANHQPGPGRLIMKVPYEVLGDGVAKLHLEPLKEFLLSRVDGQAEAVRGQFLTAGSAQAMTYARKEAEARAYAADDTVAVPFLAAEAEASGMTVSEIATEVLAAAFAWEALGSRIEAARMSSKRTIKAKAASAPAEIVTGGWAPPPDPYLVPTPPSDEPPVMDADQAALAEQVAENEAARQAAQRAMLKAALIDWDATLNPPA